MEANQDHYDRALEAEEDPAYKIFMILQAQKEAGRQLRSQDQSCGNV